MARRKKEREREKERDAYPKLCVKVEFLKNKQNM